MVMLIIVVVIVVVVFVLLSAWIGGRVWVVRRRRQSFHDSKIKIDIQLTEAKWRGKRKKKGTNREGQGHCDGGGEFCAFSLVFIVGGGRGWEAGRYEPSGMW